MVSDRITNASIPSAPNSKDFGKKKRANRSAKLKQCKLDARREQWLSQGAAKNQGCKEEKGSVRKERDRSLEKNPRQRDEENNTDGSIHHDSDLESPSSSPTNSLLGGGCGTDSGTNFTGTSSSSSSSSSSSGGCCSGSITEEEEEDECLDDWEAVADALAADDKTNKQEDEPDKHCSQLSSDNQSTVQSDSSHESENGLNLDSKHSIPDGVRIVQGASGTTARAWRPDDAFRPQCLPNLAKQRSFPATARNYGQGAVPWACKNVLAAPSSCPICYEDLDLTDTSFLPCLCGFRLCLFCHKRILEEDGRCPGCRKPYERDQLEPESSAQGGSLTFRLARSCSMIARS